MGDLAEPFLRAVDLYGCRFRIADYGLKGIGMSEIENPQLRAFSIGYELPSQIFNFKSSIFS
jgi:hypothetical protein